MRHGALTLAGGLALAALASCSRAEAPREADVRAGAALYGELCVSCHGAQGEGTRAPPVRDLHTRFDEPTLAQLIDARMPLGEPARCDARCAQDVAAFLWRELRGPVTCGAPRPLSRGLRLLTRREYEATIADLFGAPAASGAPSPPSPDGTCETTFSFDPVGRSLSSVHVAGPFNGWAATVASGGWPLARTGATWTLTRRIAPGAYPYKLVLDESEWIADPASATPVDDGDGGTTSLLEVRCAPGASSAKARLTRGFPVETRPEGFPFDNHGPTRAVTSVLMDELVRAADVVVRAIDPSALVPCARGEREPCTARLVREQGKRVLRRPLSEVEVDRYVAVARAAPDFHSGARAAIKAMLLAPSFLYRSELGEKRPDGSYALTPWEIASALSYFFWGTMPDAEAFAAAESGAIATTAGLERQARRMLASPRARASVGAFAEQWLAVEPVSAITKDEERFPFDAAVRASMLEEARRFVTHVVFDGSHRVDELFTADYTFLDETLARHYGVAPLRGGSMRLVKHDGDARAGVLGLGAVLATTGHSHQTSPIRRGLFVRRQLLCQEFGTPPPNAGGAPAIDPRATTRERFARHTSDAACKSCHQYIDDVGFGFESFDTVGRFRAKEGDKPVDARGDMNDVEGFGRGTHAPFHSLAELGRTLATSESAKACVARQVWRFARGQREEDACALSSVTQRFSEKDGDLRELMIAVATDPTFVVRR